MAYILNILPIEDDELMSSYFRRLAQANGFDNPLLFMQAFIWPDVVMDTKQNRTIRDDGFNMLRNFNKCFGDKASAIDFFINTSLYPGIRPVISNADMLILYAFRDNTDDINIIPRRYVQELKYCHVCAKNEIINKGFTWFKRSHNMPGVNVCYKHNCYLNVAGDEQKKDIYYSVSAMETEYAEFAHQMLVSAIDCSNKQTVNALKNRITELGYHIPTGGYAQFCSDTINGKLDDFMPKNTEYILKTNKTSITNNETCETMLKLLFILFRTPDTFQKYIEHDTPFMPKGYTILEYKDGLLKLQHKCGTIFVVTQELFNKGWCCPCLKTPDKNENIATHIVAACRNQYKVIDIHGMMATLYHTKCARQRDYLITNFVLNDSRCECERRKDVNEVKKDIEANRDFKLISYKDLNHYMTIEHQVCKKQFDINYYAFMSAPYCRACLQNKIGIDVKSTPPRSKKTDEASFIQDLADIVGDEYTFIGPFNGNREYTYLRHNKCGTIGRFKPSVFRQGMRCQKCAVKTSFEDFKKYVHDTTSGEYEIISYDISKRLIIKNTKTGDEYSLSKNIIMQELNRVQPSLILPVHNRQTVKISKSSSMNNDINISDYALEYYTQTTWKYLKEHFNTSDLFSRSDCEIANPTLHDLARYGKIKNVATGIYAFAENNVTTSDIIKYKYYEKYGVRFGYWQGQSFEYQLGIIPAPIKNHIASNRLLNSKRYTTKINGQYVTLYKPIAEVTNSNYKILAVIDYLTNYKNELRKRDKADPKVKIKALKEYLKDVPRDSFNAYANICTNIKKLNYWLDIIYEDGIWEHIKREFNTNELFHPDDVGATDSAMLDLVNTGKIKKIYNRLYAFPEHDVTVVDIIEYKYIERHGKLMGYWYGESFMYYLGISDKPIIHQVASDACNVNAHHYRGANEKCVLEERIRVRKPLSELTADNYKIICVIDFLSEYSIGQMNKMYFYPYPYIDLDATLSALGKYLQGIERTAFDEYMYLTKNKDLLILCLDLIYFRLKWDTIKSGFGKNQIFTSEDVGYPDSVLWAYSRTGRIKNVYENLFAMDDAVVTTDDIINYKYRLRGESRIGFWFGKSFTHHLGLIDKPEEYAIVSNNTPGIDGRRQNAIHEVLKNKIRLRKSSIIITEDNYKILSVLEYITTFRKNFYKNDHIDEETDVAALRKYLGNIPRESLEYYENSCTSKKLLHEWLDKIYGEV